jgi:hypothetical protein
VTLSYATAPETNVPEGSLSTKVAVLIVDRFICWLNVAERTTPRLTPMALSAGDVDTTAGTGSAVPEPLPHPTAVASTIAQNHAPGKRPRALRIPPTLAHDAGEIALSTATSPRKPRLPSLKVDRRGQAELD